MNRKIKIGIMGCASIAERSVIPAILNLPDLFDLRAVASRTADKARTFAGKFGCEPLTGYENLLQADIDAVYMPLPTGLHEEWVLKALGAGKHVYAEKSIAMNAASARKMVARAKSGQLTLMEGYMFQYHRQHNIVQEIVASGEIGEIRGFRSAFGFPPLAADNFRYDDKIGGGVLMDSAGYPLRAVHFMLGDHFRVRGATLYRHAKMGCHQYGAAFLSNEAGIGAHIGFGFDNFYQCCYEIWGSKGKIIAERAFTPPPDFSPELVIETPKGKRVLAVEPDNHFINALKVFAESIRFSKRERLYKEILLQSRSLDKIRALSESPCQNKEEA